MTHAIVLFDDESLAVAPTSWVRGNQVLWPAKEPSDKTVRECPEPEASFRLLNMRVIKTFGNFFYILFCYYSQLQ